MIIKGQKINDRYQIVKMIGEGGMANVYLARDTILDRDVAIKVLRGDLSLDDKFVRRFQREALSASSLSHPNIVEMYDVGEDEGKYYIVMEYVKGQTLKELIKKRGALTLPEVVDIMLQLTDALAHAHDSYIIHRDIKPQNILILDNGCVKITDFGIAMALNEAGLTQTNSVMGSVHYLPPEQANGKGSTIKSDIYSLGILMYELLMGKIPYKGDNAVEIAMKHIREPIPSVVKQNFEIPQSIENVILKATAKNPKNRYHDAKAIHQDLLTVLDEIRESEPRYIYKYSETDLDETIITKHEDNAKEVIKDTKAKSPKNKKKMTIILMAIIFGIIGIIIFFFLIFPAITETKEVRLLDFANKSVEETENKLKSLGFKNIVIEKESSEEVVEGLVTRTDPKANRTVKVTAKITIYESTGPELISIEDYTGKNNIEIKTILTNQYELKVKIEKKTVDNPANYIGKEDLIIDQSIKIGQKVKRGTSIILYIPDVIETYPDMVGEMWIKDDVNKFAEEYGLNLTIELRETDRYTEGTVISQSRTPGSTITRGSSLRVVIAKKSAAAIEEENVPNSGEGAPEN